METMSLADWKAEGEKLFGKDVKQWKFKCVRCGNVQTMQDFIDNGMTPDKASNVFFFSCLGRWKSGVGCDWTLGGLFTIHTREVINEEGKPVPVFEFAKESAVHGAVAEQPTTGRFMKLETSQSGGTLVSIPATRW